MFSSFIDTIVSLFNQIGYFGVFLAMALESSLIPLPSELIMIPAGISAANGYMNPIFVILAGGFGSLIGAIFNYYIVGKILGKPFLQKYGKYFLIKEHEYLRAEKLFLENAYLYTFLGRLTPIIRQFIPIPAGMFNMKFLPFVLLTFAGATIWMSVLVGLGYYFGNPAIELLKEYTLQFVIVFIPLLAVYLWYKIFKK